MSLVPALCVVTFSLGEEVLKTVATGGSPRSQVPFSGAVGKGEVSWAGAVCLWTPVI